MNLLLDINQTYQATDKYEKRTGRLLAVNLQAKTADVQYGKERDLEVPLTRLVIEEAKPPLVPCTYHYQELKQGKCPHASIVGYHGLIDCECGRSN